MAGEDQDILQKISQLAGQINRHKSQPPAHGSTHARQHMQPYPQRGYSSRGRSFVRGGRQPQIHRNRTLVLNGGATSQQSGESADPIDSGVSTPTGWVSKTDRHMQLINPAIYEKQSSERSRAMEETRKRKIHQRDARERNKLLRHLQAQRTGEANGAKAGGFGTSPPIHEISVEGIRFRVAKGGSKLVKFPGRYHPRNIADDQHGLCETDEFGLTNSPKTAVIGGVTFYRSKNGNLYRAGVVKAQRSTGEIKKVDEPCLRFSTTGTCAKGPRCRYVHDPSKVSICKELLKKGKCSDGEACDLSHDLTPERTPTCLHFAKGNCSNTLCRYSHVHVSPSALVCQAFGVYGYCEKGANCTERHVNECPDFSNTGVCKRKGCKLLHRLKASVIRRNTAQAAADALEDANSDLSSSDESNEVDSDDVDSDDMEFLGDDDGHPDSGIPLQEDYVHF